MKQPNCRKSFWSVFVEGFCRLLDIGGTHQTKIKKPRLRSPVEDAKKLAADWNSVGEDIQKSIDDYNKIIK